MSSPAGHATGIAYSARSSTYWYREFSPTRPGTTGWVESSGSLGAPFPFVKTITFVTVPAITTHVSFGSPKLQANLYPSSRTSSISFGAAKTRATLYPSNRTSSVSFGAATTRVSLHVPSVPSPAGVQSPHTQVSLHPNSVASHVQFNTPQTRVNLYPVARPTGVSFGVMNTRVRLFPTSITTHTSFGSAAAASTITPASIPTHTSFGTLVVKNGQAILPASITTHSSFGALTTRASLHMTAVSSTASIGAVTVRAGAVIRPASMTTHASFGAMHTRASLYPTAIASSAQTGTLSVRKIIGPTSIPTHVSFGVPQLDVVIYPPAILSNVSIQKFSVPSFAPLHIISDTTGGTATGPLSGGNRVAMVGGLLNMALGNDDFGSGTLRSLWVNAATGSGSTTPDPTNHQLVLDTGVTSGSRAGVFSSADPGDALTDLDVAATFTVQQGLVGQFGPIEAAALVLFVGSDDSGMSLRLMVRVRHTPAPDARRVTEVLLVAQGGPQFAQGLASELLARTPLDESLSYGPVRLRLLRTDGRVQAYVNGEQVADVVWSDVPVRFGLVVANASTVGAGSLSSRVTTSVSGFLRQPVVVFGTHPAPDLSGTGPNGVAVGLVLVSVPPAEQPGAVDVSVTGLQNTETLTDGYIYQTTGLGSVGGTSQTAFGVTGLTVEQTQS